MARSGDAEAAVRLLERIAAIPTPPRHWSVALGLTELGAMEATRDPSRARLILQRVIDMNWNFGGAVDRAKRVLGTLRKRSASARSTSGNPCTS